jgi:hypothetical protein
MNTNVLRQKLFLSMIKWLQTVINVRNTEEIQLGKDIPDVGSNAVEARTFPVDWSQSLLALYFNQVNGIICCQNQCSKNSLTTFMKLV